MYILGCTNFTYSDYTNQKKRHQKSDVYRAVWTYNEVVFDILTVVWKWNENASSRIQKSQKASSKTENEFPEVIEAARAKIYKGEGCDQCTNSGYKGRMGIYEILEIDKEMKQGILSDLGQTELNSLAKKNGFRTMQEMGHDLLLSGDLCFSEFERVLQS